MRSYRLGTCDEIGDVIRFAVLYIPIWVCIVLVCILYALTAKKINMTLMASRLRKSKERELELRFEQKNTSASYVYAGFGGAAYLDRTCQVDDPAWGVDSDDDRDVRRVGRQLFPFPLVLIFIWLAPTINRVQQAVVDNTDPQVG